MNNASHPAAQFCEGLTIGTFSDWYMPAQNELEVCYFNLKPTTTSNNTSSGTNTNAVPSRGSDYTAGTPAQTAATDFQTGNTQAFAAFFYWSSTEFSACEGFQSEPLIPALQSSSPTTLSPMVAFMFVLSVEWQYKDK
jgi:hypothetical protein